MSIIKFLALAIVKYNVKPYICKTFSHVCEKVNISSGRYYQ